MIKGESLRIIPLKRDRRVRVTQVDDDGNVLMEHSFPIADGTTHINYSITDEYVPDMHKRSVYATLTDSIIRVNDPR